MKVLDKALLQAVRRRPCEVCGMPGPSEASHTWAKGMGGAFHLDVEINLVALCLRCHRSHHDGGRPTRGDLVAITAVREGLRPDQVIDAVYALRRADKSADAGAIIREVTGCAAHPHNQGVAPGILPGVAPRPAPRRGAGRVATQQTRQGESGELRRDPD